MKSTGSGQGGGREGRRRRGRMGGAKAAGPGGYCVCPKCEHQVKHTLGQPCDKTKCPKCGTHMTRE
jgi:hypothetical protein